MADTVDEDIEAQSSSAVEVSDEAADSGQPDPSAGAEGNDESAGTLGIIRDVVSKDAEAEAGAEGSSPEAEVQAELEASEPDNENYSDVPFHKHPRFRELLQRAKAHEADAGRYRNVETYLRNNDLSAEEASQALDIMARIKRGDPEVWDMLRPFAQQAALQAGALLPPDLQARVSRGEISPDDAMALAKRDARVRELEQRQEAEARRAEDYRRQQDVQMRADTVEQWRRERGLRDPNFGAKEEAVTKEVTWLISQYGRPQDRAGIRAMLDKAYATVSASTTPVPAPATRPVAKSPVRSSGAGQTAGARPATPLSTHDIIKRTLGQ